jgi:hypothetical protein
VAGVVTGDATEIEQESVTLNGEFTGNGEDTHYYFEYGATTTYGMVSDVPPGKDAGEIAGVNQVSSEIGEFEDYQTYHFRLVASNSFGSTFGDDKTFTAPPAPLPEISGTSSSNVHLSSAVLEAKINPNRAMAVYAFEYGPSTLYSSSTEISLPIGADRAFHPVSSTVRNLQPGTTYHFRAVGINFAGTTYGPDQVLTTPDAPRVDLTFASGLGETTAHLGAQVSPNLAPTTVHFEYGTSDYGQSTAAGPIGSDATGHEVGADLGGLMPGTTYHFRVVASNEFGTTVGPGQIFTTLPAPAVKQNELPKCRKGFVRRHGKCVKRHRRSRKHHRHSTHRHG